MAINAKNVTKMYIATYYFNANPSRFKIGIYKLYLGQTGVIGTYFCLVLFLHLIVSLAQAKAE